MSTSAIALISIVLALIIVAVCSRIQSQVIWNRAKVGDTAYIYQSDSDTSFPFVTGIITYREKDVVFVERKVREDITVQYRFKFRDFTRGDVTFTLPNFF